jgi:hypothetical protein
MAAQPTFKAQVAVAALKGDKTLAASSKMVCSSEKQSFSHGKNKVILRGRNIVNHML